MSTIRTVVAANFRSVGADEVDVIMSTSSIARDGHVLEPRGCQLANYRLNPIVLFAHDPSQPIGNAENIVIGSDKITCRIRFAPLGISAKADEVRGLMKSGVIRAVSVGFDPIDMVPLDPKQPRGGQRITVWELLELSAVTVPADTGAMVTARAVREGKAISGANAMKLREAHDAAERCRATIAGVLAASTDDADDAPLSLEARQRQLDALRLAQPPMSQSERRRLRDLDVMALSPGTLAAQGFKRDARQREVRQLERPPMRRR